MRQYGRGHCQAKEGHFSGLAWDTSFWTGFSKNLSFKIAMSGPAGVCRASSQVNPSVNLFSKLYILQWIAFIFSRDEEEDQ